MARREFGNTVKRGQTWYARWTENGKRRMKAVGKGREGERAAKAFLRDVQRRLERGVTGTITFQGFAASFRERYQRSLHGKSWETLRPKYDAAVEFFGTMLLHEIRRGDVARFLDQVQHERDLADKTRNAYAQLLSRIFNAAIDDDLCASNPAARQNVRVKKPARVFLTEEQAYAILARLPEHMTNRRQDFIRLFASLAFETGLRVKELCALLWSDFTKGDARVVVREGKGRKGRVVPLTPRGREIVKELRQRRRSIPLHGEAPVFLKPEKFYSARFGNLMRKLGFPGVTLHSFRHAHASRLAAAGAPLTTVKDFLGHSDIQTTMIYCHSRQDALDRAVELLSSSNGVGSSVSPSR